MVDYERGSDIDSNKRSDSDSDNDNVWELKGKHMFVDNETDRDSHDDFDSNNENGGLFGLEDVSVGK